VRATTQIILRTSVAIALVLTLAMSVDGIAAAEPEASPGFTTDNLSEGVFVLRPVAGRADLSNSLVVERADGLLVVGPQASAAGAGELLRAIASLSEKPVRYLVLTSAHAEAAGGASAFPESTLVIGSVNARDSLRDPSYDFGAEVRLRSDNPKRWQAPTLRLPVMVVHARTELEDSVNEVELLPLAPAHTNSDMMVLLPNQNILYCGAVLFADRNPYARDADVGGWLSTLNHIAKLSPAVAIPLRGESLDARQVRALRDALAWVRGKIDLGFVDRIAPEQMTDWVLESEEASKYFDLEASPSFVSTVIDRALEETIKQRKKRGLM
jgi:glyoxylase-like metal-dependent hydrolase (beta-lactamase superfamily II)